MLYGWTFEEIGQLTRLQLELALARDDDPGDSGPGLSYEELCGRVRHARRDLGLIEG